MLRLDIVETALAQLRHKCQFSIDQVGEGQAVGRSVPSHADHKRHFSVAADHP